MTRASRPATDYVCQLASLPNRCRSLLGLSKAVTQLSRSDIEFCFWATSEIYATERPWLYCGSCASSRLQRVRASPKATTVIVIIYIAYANCLDCGATASILCNVGACGHCNNRVIDDQCTVRTRVNWPQILAYSGLANSRHVTTYRRKGKTFLR